MNNEQVLFAYSFMCFNQRKCTEAIRSRNFAKIKLYFSVFVVVTILLLTKLVPYNHKNPASTTVIDINTRSYKLRFVIFHHTVENFLSWLDY